MYLKKNVMVQMNDGIKLATDIYQKERGLKAPVLLSRTPYNKDGMRDRVKEYVEHGYTVVVQDVRGRYGSEGYFNPHANEGEDGAAMIQWLMDQPWCSGEIGMFGGSYLGGAQWLAAGHKPKGLMALIPEVTFDDAYEGMTFQGGAKILHDLRWVAADIVRDEVRRKEERTGKKEIRALPDVDTVLDVLPMASHPMIEEYGAFYKEWLKNDVQGEYWEKMAPYSGYADIHLPVLNISGWYDIFAASTVRNYMGMKEMGPEEIKDQQYLIMGPWSHIDYSGKFPDLEFGDMADAENMGLMDIKLKWYDRWLKGEDTQPLKSPVKVFVMGINQWKDESDWPLPQTQYESYFIRSDGLANTRFGDGVLSKENPEDEPADHFDYDPMDPVPTVGRQVLLPGENAIGPKDQSLVEMRKDVLVYTSGVLEEDLETIGSVQMVLYASSKARDTDFTVKLVDVYPDGRAILLTDGIIRARYRNSTRNAEFMVPEEVYEFCIDVGPTANVFLKGHRIRVEISSSNFPRFNRNSNTGGNISEETASEYKKVINHIHHSRQYPSRLVLPVIKRNHNTIE